MRGNLLHALGNLGVNGAGHGFVKHHPRHGALCRPLGNLVVVRDGHTFQIHRAGLFGSAQRIMYTAHVVSKGGPEPPTF